MNMQRMVIDWPLQMPQISGLLSTSIYTLRKTCKIKKIRFDLFKPAYRWVHSILMVKLCNQLAQKAEIV